MYRDRTISLVKDRVTLIIRYAWTDNYIKRRNVVQVESTRPELAFTARNLPGKLTGVSGSAKRHVSPSLHPDTQRTKCANLTSTEYPPRCLANIIIQQATSAATSYPVLLCLGIGQSGWKHNASKMLYFSTACTSSMGSLARHFFSY